MENEEDPQLFVSDPLLIKDGVTSFTSYKLQGTKIPEPINRRYRDFAALRKKLVEYWPGVFIPNIPHKKTVGNTDKEIVDLRIAMINRFLKKLSNIDFLFNSDIMNYFLENSNNVPKTLDNFKTPSYEQLLKNYNATFTDYDQNFDTIKGKEEQDIFYKQLCAIYPKLRNFRTFIFQEKERFKIVHENYYNVINNISVYEKEIMNRYVGDDENRLIFYNMKNIDLCKNISNVQEKIVNPYNRLYESITEDYLDTEAMQEAFETLKGLQDNYNKLTKNLTSINVQLNDLNAGKTNVKSLLKFKGKEECIKSLNSEKDAYEKDIEHLGLIIKIATHNMQGQIKKFKLVRLEKYYNELSRIEKDIEFNSKILDDLWETVVKDKNIAEYN